MRYIFTTILLLSIIKANDINQSFSSKDESNITQKHLKEQIEKEKKYAKEKTFYEGKDYNLSDKKISSDQLKNVPLIKPEDDFDMTDVYSDEQ